jgi:protein-S-isoprenylcysteine O-methyltransferase Ste14
VQAGFEMVAYLFVLGYEEPKLRSTFGAEYERFRANVPRWIPSVRGWKGR